MPLRERGRDKHLCGEGGVNGRFQDVAAIPLSVTLSITLVLDSLCGLWVDFVVFLVSIFVSVFLLYGLIDVAIGWIGGGASVPLHTARGVSRVCGVSAVCGVCAEIVFDQHDSVHRLLHGGSPNSLSIDGPFLH